MYSKVTVVADESGAVIHQSKSNPDYGYVKLVQTRSIIDEESGFLRMQNLSTLLHGRIFDLQLIGYEENQELPGRIVISESMQPFNSKHPDYDLKIAGKTGIICTVGGKPIYRKTKYVLKEDTEDVFIEHDEECKTKLRAAYEAQKEQKTSGISPNHNFDLEES
jgi:hypothetical protein